LYSNDHANTGVVSASEFRVQRRKRTHKVVVSRRW